IANARAYLLDAQGSPVPVGVPGELYLGGAGLARGYWDRPALTAERFLPDPFGDTAGGRLYKTGDLARWQSDGEIEFLGRADNQVKIRGYRIEPGEIEAALLRHPAVREAVVVAREDAPGDPRLVAYIVPVDPTAPEAADLRPWLKRSLPDYMVPSAFVTLRALPLSPNGKVDHKALPAPSTVRPGRERALVAPRDPVEGVLATVTAGVLGHEAVGVHDNFFDLGLDSILSIQIVSRARQAGLHLSPSQLFQYPTIADLALVAGTAAPVLAEQGTVVGPVPLTPIQRWFLEQDQPEPHHFNQAVLLEVNPAPDPAPLAEAVRHLVGHHDALRLRFARGESGWEQVNAEDEGEVPFARVDLSALAEAEQGSAIAASAAAAQASLDLGRGPIVRAVLFHLGASRPARLLLVVHHLAVDGVSWRILLEDLAGAYQQLRRGEPPRLPRKTTSFRQWSEALAQFAASGALGRERSYWLAERQPPVVPLPVDLGAHRDPGTSAQAATVSVALDAETTRALLQEVPLAYNTQINDALLTALAQTLAGWSGSRTVLVDLEGHGREELVEGVDLSRTVGWFTTVFPVDLTVDPADPPGEALRAVQEQLRSVPRRGIGYGLLRHLGPDRAVAEQLRSRPGAEVRFNYPGQFDQTLPAKVGFPLPPESAGPVYSPNTRRVHLLEIESQVVEGQLRLDWTYGTGAHRQETIRALAERFLEALRALIAHCRAPETRGYIPADFPLARLDQATIDRAFAGEREIEDVYPLSPVQEGMLFHTTYAPESGVYVQQFTCRLHGTLDVPAFAEAWRSVLDRHPVLRTAFPWIDADRPMQVVYRHVPLPLEEQDWRGLGAIEQEERLETYFSADRVRGFVPAWAPLLRLALFRLADDVYRVVWSHHHLVMDGWCLPILLKEVLAFYVASSRGETLCLPTPRPFREYIAWLQEQDLRRAELYWRRELRGFDTATPLGIDRPETGASGSFAERRDALPVGTTAALQGLGRSSRLTLNTLVQGAWALILSRYSGQTDVVFGATVSGRPAALAGVESMVGLFINTLPVRVQVPEDARLVPWLKRLQEQQVELRQHEHSPLVQVQGWSDVPRGQPLFESILVFENYPLDASLSEQAGVLGFEEVRVLEQTNYPLTIMAIPGNELRLRVGYNARRFDEGAIDRLLGHLRNVLEAFAADADRRLADIPLMSRSEQDRVLRGWDDRAPERASARDDDPDTILAELDRLSNPELDALIGRFLGTEEASHE
ncbi:MAG TPA: condensation domain-containing protein, partial [Isosphaeraceae bacterium]|nr:condensation domain-containing protein [Isosphaeraceae bacterium]